MTTNTTERDALPLWQKGRSYTEEEHAEFKKNENMMRDNPALAQLRAPYGRLILGLRRHVDRGGFDGDGPNEQHQAAADAIEQLLVALQSQIEISNTERERAESLARTANASEASEVVALNESDDAGPSYGRYPFDDRGNKIDHEAGDRAKAFIYRLLPDSPRPVIEQVAPPSDRAAVEGVSEAMIAAARNAWLTMDVPAEIEVNPANDDMVFDAHIRRALAAGLAERARASSPNAAAVELRASAEKARKFLAASVKTYEQESEDEAGGYASQWDQDADDIVAQLSIALAPNPEWPECSGDPACCPENEGYGRCKPNPNAAAAVGQAVAWIDGADIGFLGDKLKSRAYVFPQQELPCMVPLYTAPNPAAYRQPTISDQMIESALDEGFNGCVTVDEMLSSFPLSEDEKLRLVRSIIEGSNRHAVIPADGDGTEVRG